MIRRDKISINIVWFLQEKGPMSRAEINKCLIESAIIENELPRTSWNRYLDNIRKCTPYHIVFDSNEMKYYLKRRKKFKQSPDSLLEYLLASYNVLESASLLMKHSDKVFYADTIAGTAAINIVLQAIDENRSLTFTYTSFVNETTKTRTFIPYFLSTWEGRWYLVAEAETHPGDLYMYALDRMSNVRMSFEKVKKKLSITKEDFFRYSYGVQHAEEDEAKEIIIRAFGSKAKYIRSKPIHPSQEEIATTPDYSDFRLCLAPCYNFYQQLLFQREGIQVLQPAEVRNELITILSRITDNYKK